MSGTNRKNAVDGIFSKHAGTLRTGTDAGANSRLSSGRNDQAEQGMIGRTGTEEVPSLEIFFNTIAYSLYGLRLLRNSL